MELEIFNHFFCISIVLLACTQGKEQSSMKSPSNPQPPRHFYLTSKDLCPDLVLYSGGPGDPRRHTESHNLNFKYLDIVAGVETHLPLACVSPFSLAKDFEDGYTFEPLAIVLVNFSTASSHVASADGKCDFNMKFKGQNSILPDNEIYSCRPDQTNTNYTLLLNSKARLIHFWRMNYFPETSDEFLKFTFISFYNSTSCYSTEQLHRIDRAFGGDHACLRHRDDEFSHVCGSRRIDVTDCLSLWEEYRLPSAISELLEDPRFQKNELKLVAGDGDDSGGIEDSQWDDRVSRLISVSLAGIVWLYFVFYAIGNMVRR